MAGKWVYFFKDGEPCGVDAVTVAEFESDLKNNLYKIWNRLSSGTYFPPPMRAVEISKSHGGGTRILRALIAYPA